MQNEKRETGGLTLLLALSVQDAELLRVAVPTTPARRDGLGIKDTGNLAQTAIGAVARALLREGYRPQPLGAEMRPAGTEDREPLAPGVIRLQFAYKGEA